VQAGAKEALVDEVGLRVVDGVVHVAVRVKPRASRSRVLGFKEGALQVAVAAPPVDGKANSELLGTLSRALAVPKSCLELVQGRTGRNKRIVVRGVTLEHCRLHLGKSE
jgi:uncharacterized protein (TIGR00251 family)